MFRPIPVEQEPKLKNRYILEFPTELDIESYLVQTSARPKLETENTEIPFMNTSTWVAGRSVWQTMDIEFIDVIGPSTSQKVMEWVRLHFEPSTGRMGYAVGYKKNLVLKQLDPPGVGIEKWTLVGCQITNTDFTDNDYSSSDFQKVSITIQPDRCILGA